MGVPIAQQAGKLVANATRNSVVLAEDTANILVEAGLIHKGRDVLLPKGLIARKLSPGETSDDCAVQHVSKAAWQSRSNEV
jgi:hypothetical protein